MNLSMKQVADRLGVCTKTIQRIIARGELPAIKLSHRCVRVAETDLNAYLESRKS